MNYSFLLKTKTGNKWSRIGIHRRAGVAVPLFSIYSADNQGIGSFDDIKILIDWCNEAGMTILQLLPLNEVGNDFSPYNSISSFAIDPMYLSVNKLSADYEIGARGIAPLSVAKGHRVDYAVKSHKLKFLWYLYQK